MQGKVQHQGNLLISFTKCITINRENNAEKALDKI